MKRFSLILAFFGLILSACTVTVDEEPGRPPRPPRPEMCPRIYEPVCAERFGDRETFSNSCVARSEGFAVLYGGQCRSRPPRPQACPRDYNPVCASKPGDRRTMPNACVARAEGYRVNYSGECRGKPDPANPNRVDPVPGGGVACPMIHAPVCARQGAVLRTFGNACMAEGSGFTIIRNGDC